MAEVNHSHFSIPNTLGTKSTASFGMRASTVPQIVAAQAFARQKGLRFIPVGEGSNIIAHAHVQAFVCQIQLQGVEILSETSRDVVIRIGAGENWHQLVQHCIAKGWFGLENLALIPGSVGAAPVQNIGAYGVEVASFIESVETIDDQGLQNSITGHECGFAYRDSIFKKHADKTILRIILRLSKQPNISAEYPDLKDMLEDMRPSKASAGGSSKFPTPADVAAAVIKLRQQKLPDPKVVPNAGSFFKNPVVSSDIANRLIKSFPLLKVYPGAAGTKISAAALIDQAGWKNKALHGVKCWHKQALVITNPDGASAEEVLQFAEAIRADIKDRYGIDLEREPYELS